MNIPKLIAGLRSELELVEASIHDFETLAKAREPPGALTTVEIGFPRVEISPIWTARAGMESEFEKRLRPSSGLI